jgi:diguanylate cyclase (GGDEF)-like protein
MEQSLRTLSLTDELTGLYNRRGFLTLAEQQLKTAKRLRCGMLLLSADLDNLKRINDIFGHQEGDFALTQAAAILKKTFREPDITARMSGDEFAVLMMETSMTDLKTLTSRLQGELDAWSAQSEREYRLSLSIGIAYCAPPCDNSIDRLLRKADQLMYEQKREDKEGN